jgi:phospholipid/cholesterol/gamma-HCH transport system substrate-binding protein
METRANYILIGVFTLVVLAAGFGFVYWFSQSGAGSERVSYRILFEGSVTGLRPGASVLFNGIRVGEVVDLRLDANNPKQVGAVVSIDRAVQVRSDTRVGLDFQGLTGIASITLKGVSDRAPVLKAERGELPTLSADPNATKDVTQAVRDVATTAEATIKRLDNLVAENESALKDIVTNVKSFSGALAQNGGSISDILVNVKGFTETLNRNSERLDHFFAGLENLTAGETNELLETVRSIRTLADNLDKRTAEISAGLTRFSTRGLREWEQLAVDGRRMVATLDQAIKNFDRNPSRLIFGGGSSDPQATGSTDRPAPAAAASTPRQPTRRTPPRPAPAPAIQHAGE